LLASGNPDCLKLVDNLRMIPKSEQLIQQIKNLDFQPATVSLAELIATMQSS
jgi:hypothetical protein